MSDRLLTAHVCTFARTRWKKLLLHLLLCHTVSAVNHSLKFFFTGTSTKTTFPEFLGITTVDDVEIGYCNNITKRAESKQDWIRRLMKKNPQLLQLFPNECLHNHYFLMADMDVFKQRLHQNEGSHVLQRMSGCEWDDESGETKGFLQYGYDGEDFIALDLQTMTWITPKAQAVVIKHLWDADKVRLEGTKKAYISVCPKDLTDYVHYGKSFLQRIERPLVSLLQKTPSSLVSCHATGFYPHRAKLFWRKDGDEIHEGVEKGQILPNNDGTFQMSSGLNVSLVKHEDWRRYECVFQLSGVKEDIIIILEKAQIQTNWVSTSEFPGGLVGGVVVAAVVVLLVLISVLGFCWQNNGCQSTENTQSRTPFLYKKEEHFSGTDHTIHVPKYSVGKTALHI